MVVIGVVVRVIEVAGVVVRVIQVAGVVGVIA